MAFRPHYLEAELGITLLLPLARVSRDDQIHSLDVTKAAQLLEKRGVGWIAPTFVHVSNGDRRANEGDAVRLCSFLRARRNRPRGQNSNSFNAIASSHFLPRSSGHSMVPAQTCPGSGPAHVRFGSKADIGARPIDVRLTPESGHHRVRSPCPLCAKSGLMRCSKSVVVYFANWTRCR